MNQSTFEHPVFSLNLVAHGDNARNLLMLTIEVASEIRAVDPVVNCAIVIDRSGSMAGAPIAIATAAAGTFIRSLDAQDHVGVVAYDDHVDIVSGMTLPSQSLANKVERIQCGGSTALYEGWLTGAKIVGAGGRVILLSDGHANVGRFTDAWNLSNHAGISYRRYRVTTSTIGIGESYDEALMAGMAREGGGGHYYAHTVEAVLDAFSRERHALGSIVLEQVSFRFAGQTVQLGHLFGGERKSIVLAVKDLSGEATLRFKVAGTNEVETLAVRVPESFGHSDEVTLEWLLARVADVEEEIVQVRDPRSAGQAKEKVRTILLSLLAHPKADEESVQSVIARLEGRIERLDQLVRDYDEGQAIMERKHSLQWSHNTRNRSRAYSSFEEDVQAVKAAHMMSVSPQMARVPLSVLPEGLALAPVEQWAAWVAVPVALRRGVVMVAMVDPTDGFRLQEIQKALGRKVVAVRVPYDAAEILQALGR